MPTVRNLPEQEIVNLYLDGYSIHELSDIFNIDRQSIKKRLIKNNVNLRSLSEANKIYSIDDNIFDLIDCHEKSYWLGFLAADGNVYNKTIKVGLSTKDIHHLYRFKKFLNYTGKIITYMARCKDKEYPCCEMAFRSVNIQNKLAEHNIIANKSNILEFSKLIPNEFISSYILGAFDGDGCFNILSHKRSYIKVPQMRLSILMAKDIIENIRFHLMKNCELKENKLQKYKRCDNIYVLQYGGNLQLVRICNYLYSNATMFLPRKKKIILDFFKDKIINQDIFPSVDYELGLVNNLCL